MKCFEKTATDRTFIKRIILGAIVFAAAVFSVFFIMINGSPIYKNTKSFDCYGCAYSQSAEADIRKIGSLKKLESLSLNSGNADNLDDLSSLSELKAFTMRNGFAEDWSFLDELIIKMKGKPGNEQ